MELKKGFKSTEVGVVPQDWNVVEVGCAYEICNNLRLPINRSIREQMSGPYPYYGPTGIQGWINECRVEGEYALIGEDGDHFLKWRHQTMTQLVGGKFNVNNHAHLVRGTRNLTEWFAIFFSNRDVSNYLTRQGAGRFKLTKASLLKMPVALPPTLAEQVAIAGALSDADAWIESLEQLIAKKRQIKHGAMQELLTGRRRLPGFNGEWKVKRLEELGAFLKGSGVTKSQASSGELPCVRYGEIYTRHNDYVRGFYSKISHAVALTATPIRQGDLLFAGSGETKEEIGKCVAIAHDCEAFAGGDIVILRAIKGDPVFLGYYLNTSPMARQKASRGQGDAVVHISAAALSLITGHFPEEAEQQAIGRVLLEMDLDITEVESKIAKARQIKQAMMQELLTGRIRLVKPTTSSSMTKEAVHAC